MVNYLLVVEGQNTEKNILSSILEKYGLNVIKKDKINIEGNDKLEFDSSEFEKDNKNIVLIQGPRNRIRDLLLLFEKKTFDFEKWLLKTGCRFSGIFFIYDVDHTLKEDLQNLFEVYHNETDGMLLVSSPCIEILSEPNRKDPIIFNNLSEYKRERNIKINREYGLNCSEYIIKHFEDLVLYYLEKNYNDSKLKNVLDHPQFVVDNINRYNIRKFISKDDQPVNYCYFTTVLYCAIAYIFGLTKKIDNYNIVYKFFSNKKSGT